MSKISRSDSVGVLKSLTANKDMFMGFIFGVLLTAMGVFLPQFTSYYIESIYLILLGIGLIISCLHTALLRSNEDMELVISKKIVVPALISLVFIIWFTVKNLQAGIFSAFCIGVGIESTNIFLRWINSEKQLGKSFYLLLISVALSIATIFFPFMILVMPFRAKFSAIANNIFGEIPGILLSTFLIFATTGTTDKYIRTDSKIYLRKTLKNIIIGSISIITVIIILILFSYTGIGPIYLKESFYIGILSLLFLIVASILSRTER
ncbi:MAG: hypothetical protein Q6363_000655 [Candidatus Njordarchaeota archaeon]